MKHKLRKLISLVLATTFLWQGVLQATDYTSGVYVGCYFLRARSAAEREDIRSKADKRGSGESALLAVYHLLRADPELAGRSVTSEEVRLKTTGKMPDGHLSPATVTANLGMLAYLERVEKEGRGTEAVFRAADIKAPHGGEDIETVLKGLRAQSTDLEKRGAKARLTYNQNIVPVVTPLIHAGDKIIIDRIGIRRLIDHLLSLGVRSILVMGETGEFRDLSNDKRLEAIRIFAEESKGRLTIFANASGDTEKETIQNIRELEKMPHINAIAITPLYYLGTNDEIILHVQRIRSCLPLVIYNNPNIHKTPGLNISPDVLRDFKDIVIAIKDSSGDLELLDQYAAYMRTFVGDESKVVPALQRGADGAVSSMGNAVVFPQLIFNGGQTVSEQERLQSEIIRLRPALTAHLGKTPAALKEYLRLIGVLASEDVARPDKMLADAEKKAVAEVYREQQVAGQQAAEHVAPPRTQTSEKRYRELLLKDASLDKDYFELLFKVNMDLLVLARKRMLAKDTGDRETYVASLYEIQELVDQIKDKIDTYGRRNIRGESIATTRDYREEVKQHLDSAVRMIRRRNEQAANAAIWAALNDITRDRREIASLSKNANRRYLKADRVAGAYSVYMGWYARLEDALTTMRVGGERRFDLLWQACASCDDQIDSELTDRVVMKGLIERLDAILNMIERGKIDEAQGQCAAALEELGRRKEVEEKRLGIIALETAVELLKITDVKTARDVIRIAYEFFTTRFDNTKVLAEAIQAGRVGELRYLAVERNRMIIKKFVNPIKKFVSQQDFKTVRRLLSRATREFMGEPEFRGLMPLIWKSINDIRRKKDPATIKKDVTDTMKKLVWRIRASYELGRFMQEYRDNLVKRALAQGINPRLIQEPVFRSTFEDFLKRRGMIRDFPDLFWTMCYQAAFVSLKINNPQRPAERIPNPAFNAIDALVLIKLVDNYDVLANSIKFPNQNPQTTKHLRVLSGAGKKRYTALAKEDKEAIVQALIKDHGLSGRAATMLGDASNKNYEGTYKHIFDRGVRKCSMKDEDPYSPLMGVDLCRRAVARYISAQIKDRVKLKVDAESVIIGPGAIGAVELLRRMFTNPKPREELLVSDRFFELYEKLSLRGITVTKGQVTLQAMLEELRKCKAQETQLPRIIVADAQGIGQAAARELCAFTRDNNIQLVYDITGEPKDSAAIFDVLNESPSCKKNTLVLADFGRYFGFRGYPITALLYFNSDMDNAYKTAAGGSIAAPSQAMQAGLVELLTELTPRYDDSPFTSITLNNITIPYIQKLYRVREPDPTLSFSIFYYLKKEGIPWLFLEDDFVVLQELKKILGKERFNKDEIQAMLQKAVSDSQRGEKPFEQIHEKAQGLEIWKDAKDCQNESVGRQNLLKPNDGVIKVLSDALRDDKITYRETILLEVLLHIIPLHVGAPSFPRPDFVKKALVEGTMIDDASEEDLTRAVLSSMRDYLRRYFGVSYWPGDTRSGEIASGFYGSKPALQEFCFIVGMLTGKEVEAFQPTPYYVGDDSLMMTIGVPDERIIRFATQEKNLYVPTPDELEASLSSTNDNFTKVVVLTTPGNPTSSVITEEQMKDLIRVAYRKGAYVALDIAYGVLIFNGRPFNLGRIAQDLSKEFQCSPDDILSKVAFVMTQSKEELGPGGRLGSNAIRDTKLNQMIKRMNVLETDDVAKYAQAIVYSDYNAPEFDKAAAAHVEHLRTNAQIPVRAFGNMRIRCLPPQGGFYILSDNEFNPWDFGFTYVAGEPFYAFKRNRFALAGPRYNIMYMAECLQWYWERYKLKRKLAEAGRSQKGEEVGVLSAI